MTDEEKKLLASGMVFKKETQFVKEEVAPPKKDVFVKKDDYIPLKDDAPVKKDDVIPPKENVAKANDVIPPKDNDVVKKADIVPPKDGVKTEKESPVSAKAKGEASPKKDEYLRYARESGLDVGTTTADRMRKGVESKALSKSDMRDAIDAAAAAKKSEKPTWKKRNTSVHLEGFEKPSKLVAVLTGRGNKTRGGVFEHEKSNGGKFYTAHAVRDKEFGDREVKLVRNGDKGNSKEAPPRLLRSEDAAKLHLQRAIDVLLLDFFALKMLRNKQLEQEKEKLVEKEQEKEQEKELGVDKTEDNRKELSLVD